MSRTWPQPWQESRRWLSMISVKNACILRGMVPLPKQSGQAVPIWAAIALRMKSLLLGSWLRRSAKSSSTLKATKAVRNFFCVIKFIRAAKESHLALTVAVQFENADTSVRMNNSKKESGVKRPLTQTLRRCSAMLFGFATFERRQRARLRRRGSYCSVPGRPRR